MTVDYDESHDTFQSLKLTFRRHQWPFLSLPCSFYFLLLNVMAVVLETSIFANCLSFPLHGKHNFHIVLWYIFLDVPFLEAAFELYIAVCRQSIAMDATVSALQ